MRRPFAIDPARLRLQAEMLLWRTGWLPVLAVVLLLVTGIQLAVMVPMQRLRVQALEQELAAAERAAPGRVATPPPVSPLQSFQQVLMPQSGTIDLLRQIHQLAAHAGVNTVQADLRRLDDNAGLASQLQIALPAHGDYLALRRFCLSLLASEPSLAIDQIVFKREQVASNQLDAQIVVSVWQQTERRAPVAGEQP